MKKLHLLPADERKEFFEVVAYEKKIPFEIAEKDYWVVWTLEQLFALEDLNAHLTFKGGTSLSKVYRLIERFSEDVDLSIERRVFGFDEAKDPERAPSKKKRQAILDELSRACSKYVQGKMLANLKTRIAESLETKRGWSVEIDPDDPDGQTLFFRYPSITPADGYIRPFVKIEMGSRSEHWPVSRHWIQSYAKEVLQEKIQEDQVAVRVLSVERTFWEKATILHQYAHLPEAKAVPPRLSRHFYDFFCLLKSEAKKQALGETALLDRVATHKSIYFSSSWANYDTARKGTLKLSPLPRVLKDLENDYQEMKAMFFGEIPDWHSILQAVRSFEDEFNR